MELKSIEKFLEEKYGKKVYEAIEGINETGIGYLIPYTMHCIGQIHIWHLLCPSGQKHTALGGLYDDLVTNIDELSEKFIAQGGIISETEPYKYISMYNENEIYNYINSYRTHISSVIENSMGSELKSIQDSVIDLQEVIDSFLYKFKLD